METKWHENIPENGVLCKKTNGAVRLIKSVIGNVAYFDNQCNGIHVDDLTPLTAAEWWDFAPWKDMKDAPPNDRILILCENGNIETAFPLNKGIWQGCNSGFNYTPVKWLPFPTSDLREALLNTK